MPSVKMPHHLHCFVCSNPFVAMVPKGLPPPRNCSRSCANRYTKLKREAALTGEPVEPPATITTTLWHWGTPNFVERNGRYTLVQPKLQCVSGTVAEHVDRMVFRGHAMEPYYNPRGGRRKEYA